MHIVKGSKYGAGVTSNGRHFSKRFHLCLFLHPQSSWRALSNTRNWRFNFVNRRSSSRIILRVRKSSKDKLMVLPSRASCRAFSQAYKAQSLNHFFNLFLIVFALPRLTIVLCQGLWQGIWPQRQPAILHTHWGHKSDFCLRLYVSRRLSKSSW